jgi:DNA-binding CsgD family transcriptional regulator
MLRLEPALEEGLIELANGRILFTNPLITSALQRQLTPDRREQLHRTLSQIAPNEEEQARHLALGTPAPDRSVAATVERAAHAARLRGAPGTAKELLDESIRLTPVDDERDHIRRTLEATEVSFEAGDTARTLASLTALRQRLGPGHDRAQVLRRLGVVKGELESAPAAIELFEAALSEAQGDRILEAEIHRDLAWMTTWATDLQSAREHARRAVDLGGSTTEASVLAEILAAAVYVEFAIGGGIRSDLLERALVLEGGGAQVRLDRSPTLVKGVILLALDRLDEARTCFETLLHVATDRGDESNVSTANYYIGLVQLRAGNWALAGDRIEEGLEISEQTGVNRQVLTYARSLLDAHLGRVEAATRRAERDVKAWETQGEKLYLLRNLALLGFLALSCADPARAASYLRRARSLADEIGFGEPSLLLFHLDEVESLVSVGELEKARTLLDSFEERARGLDRGSALAGAERCRGILLAARGDLLPALVALEQAVTRYERLSLPFERGRSLLALGATQRRAKQRRQARKTLEEASHVFEELGARLWLERTRADLRRIGGRPSAAGRLTPTEQRVAALVAEGRSNKEVAATLFVTVKTVEANLTRIYPKLGVRSRAELAHRFAETGEPSNL